LELLKIEGLSKSYKALKVLNNINLEVKAGERHVIIGPNGAGKTTLIHSITGVIPVNGGRVFINGKDVTNLPSHTRVSAGMGRTFQRNNLFEKLTVEENIHLAIAACKPYKRKMFKSPVI
jgi:branched-chain amino acid transport system ATP-binding protein